MTEPDHSILKVSSMPHPEALTSLGGKVTQRWINFGRLLRRNGVHTTAGQIRDLLRALPLVDLLDREAVYYASRAVLCSRREDMPKFDLVFRQFWGRTRQIIIPSDTGSLDSGQPATGGGSEPPPGQSAPKRTLPAIDRNTLADSDESNTSSPFSGDETELERALLYSAEERLRNVDFARFTEEEIAQARAVLASWKWRPSMRRTRRMAPSRRGKRLDFSRTLRKAMKTQGIPYSLAMRGPRHKPRPLVLLCDISGSMAPYTRMMLHFLHTIRRGVSHAEVFVFGTRLTRVTRQLRARDVDQALAAVSKQVVDWSGGTRLGEALRVFNTAWARRVLGQGAVVCIISDGWDRGDPVLLASEMAHLQRMSFRLIWLNPLLGLAGYQPLTRGMAAALPYVDDFLPANNLAGLQSMAVLLSGLNLSIRPARRQAIVAPAVAPPPFSPEPPRFSVRV